MRWWQQVFSRYREPPMQVKLITEWGEAFRAWDGSIYKSDIVRAAIRPKVKAIGKLMAMHVREDASGLKVNPEPYMRVLLEDPNPYSGGQLFRERMATLLAVNNNAFARIYRDQDGYPVQIYPLRATSAEAVRKDDGMLYVRFQLAGASKPLELPYADVIHLRDDYNDNDLFGSSKADSLKSMLDVISASDQSIVQAVKRSSVIRWMMKFKVNLKPEDKKQQVKEFSEQFLSLENETGVAASDPARYDLEPVKHAEYVPSSPHQQKAIDRIHAFFGTNEKIVQAKFTEDDWIAYYEAEIEPLAQQMSEEFTRKLFTRRERGFGNRIVFGATDLSYASMKTKLELRQMVDRGAMVPNEWRRVLNLPPIEGGEKPVRRLDTAEVGKE
ncbi:MAG TPA: phage portal protein [Symbiobacteriaceae bacterium]|nr:phage portal protein [Symbiobacteriaceae bacterium]